jgi:hypothetical protein
MQATRPQHIRDSRTSAPHIAGMDLKGGYAVSQRARRRFGAMPLVSGKQASCGFGHEGTISATWLEEPRPGEVGFAVPTNGVENLADHLRLGVNSAAAMEGPNFGRHDLCGSVSPRVVLRYRGFDHWLLSSNAE